MKKIIVVTGASSGMGKEFVYQITKKVKVQEVWLIARRKDKLKEIAEQLNIQTKIIPIDLSTKEGLDKYKSKLAKEKPMIRILAICSGFGKLNH